jgi:hypothetical protein
MRRLRKRSKGIRLLVEPTTLLLRLREDLAQRFPEVQRAVADRPREFTWLVMGDDL